MVDKNKKIDFLIYIAIFFVVLAVNIFYLANKVGLHVDETISYAVANAKDVKLDMNVKLPTGVYYGRTLKRYLLYAENEIISRKDIKKIIVEAKKSGQPPLYFLCLRGWIQGADISTIEKMATLGASLNLLFLTVTFWTVLAILKRIFENRWYISLALIVGFLNTAIISNNIFIRPYCMQMTFYSLFTYWFVRNLQGINSGMKIFTLKNVLSFITLALLLFMTGYLTIFYILICVLVLTFFKIKNKKLFLALLGLGWGICFILARFFICKMNLNSYTAMFIVKNFALFDFISNVQSVITNGISDFVLYYLYLPMIFLVTAVLLINYRRDKFVSLKEKIKNAANLKNIPFILFFTSLLWIALVLWLIAVKSIRYYVVALPIFSIVFPYLCTFVKRRHLVFAIIAIIYIVGALTPKGSVFENMLSYSKINYLYIEQKEFFEILSSKNLPIMFDEDLLARKTTYIYKYIALPYLKDDVMYPVNFPIDTSYPHYFIISIDNRGNNPVFIAAEAKYKNFIRMLDF